jgi:hypothetical protein
VLTGSGSFDRQRHLDWRRDGEVHDIDRGPEVYKTGECPDAERLRNPVALH